MPEETKQRYLKLTRTDASLILEALELAMLALSHHSVMTMWVENGEAFTDSGKGDRLRREFKKLKKRLNAEK